MSANSIQSFPALQGTTLTGKTKVWSIEVRHQDGNGVIVTTHGQQDGKMQINEKIISEGKNIGKKNETTPFDQAVSEARAAWTKKRESNYTPIDESEEDDEDD